MPWEILDYEKHSHQSPLLSYHLNEGLQALQDSGTYPWKIRSYYQI